MSMLRLTLNTLQAQHSLKTGCKAHSTVQQSTGWKKHKQRWKKHQQQHSTHPPVSLHHVEGCLQCSQLLAHVDQLGPQGHNAIKLGHKGLTGGGVGVGSWQQQLLQQQAERQYRTGERYKQGRKAESDRVLL